LHSFVERILKTPACGFPIEEKKIQINHSRFVPIKKKEKKRKENPTIDFENIFEKR